jgi:hypothetical protein
MKFKAILGAAVVLGAMMFATVTAQAATTYKVGAEKGSKGSQVTLPISVSSDTGSDTLNGFIIKLEYDATQAVPVQNQNGDDEALLSLYGSTPLTEGVFVSDRLEAGKGTTAENLAVAWAAADKHTVSKDGEVIANVTFDVNENATADSIPVKITVLQVATDDKTLETSGFTVSAGSIDLASIVYGDADGNGSLTSYDASVVLQHLSDTTLPWTEAQETASDVDLSGTVNSFDVSLILQALADETFTLPYQG